MSTSESFVACSNCFINEGLRLDADRLGEDDASPCPRCEAIDGQKLGSDRLAILAHDFFVWGSVHRLGYGAAPRIQFNDRRETELELPTSLRSDAAVFEETLGIGFFLYGPRLWLLGEVEPLKALQCDETRADVIDRILREYGSRSLSVEDKFYRIRKNPDEPWEGHQYDSPPPGRSDGRLNTAERPVLYASPDLQTCLHECRVTAEDDLYMATLRPAGKLELLDVAVLLEESREVTEFESLDLAIIMLFLAGKHSYSIAREISHAARRVGFDGIVYPSYFSMLRNGVKPFETAYGMSLRRFSQYRDYEQAKVSDNFAIFGRPIEDGRVEVCCINRVMLGAVSYAVHFGPVLGDE